MGAAGLEEGCKATLSQLGGPDGVSVPDNLVKSTASDIISQALPTGVVILACLRMNKGAGLCDRLLVYRRLGDSIATPLLVHHSPAL